MAKQAEVDDSSEGDVVAGATGGRKANLSAAKSAKNG